MVDTIGSRLLEKYHGSFTESYQIRATATPIVDEPGRLHAPPNTFKPRHCPPQRPTSHPTSSVFVFDPPTYLWPGPSARAQGTPD